MNITEVNRGELKRYRPAHPVIGMDIGSRAAKGVLLTPDSIYTEQVITGLSMQKTADELLNQLLKTAALRRSKIAYIVGTGYGRISIQFGDIPYRVVTEITCHALGAHALNPGTRTIIDIGGQDSKAIKVDPATGKVVEFVMNDKCAAGTGRFLEKTATTLGLELSELGDVALKAKSPFQISSQCVVFAESEVISLKARGGQENSEETCANIAAGIHYSTARRVKSLLSRVGLEPELIFSGGVSNNPGMWQVLEEVLDAKFTRVTGINMTYAGALGAAVDAGRHVKPKIRVHVRTQQPVSIDFSTIQKAVEKEQTAFITRNDGSKKAGYICAYTPPELLTAAGILSVRLYKGGDTELVSQGELYTQSIACDFSKSTLGAFAKGDPLYRAVDKVYNFHVCASLKRASEVASLFTTSELFSLPRLRRDNDSHEFFKSELLAFRKDLEELSGRTISAEDLHQQIVLYNKLRRILKKISELRKRPYPVISGQEYVDLVRAYYYLPPQEALQHYEALYRQLRNLPDPEQRVIRLMLSGSIVADGDRRLLHLIENELGARVVVEDHCTGLRPFYHTVRESGDPFQALADGYLDQAPCARMKPIEDATEFSMQLAQEYDVDAVIYSSLKFCACYALPQIRFIEGFQELGLPVLSISNDYSQNDHGQLKTRVETFISVIQEKRSTEHEQFVSAE